MNPVSNTPPTKKKSDGTSTNLPSHKPSKKDEQDMRDTAKKPRQNHEQRIFSSTMWGHWMLSGGPAKSDGW